MKFGIPLGGVHPGRWRDLTVRAEELGYESVWIPMNHTLDQIPGSVAKLSALWVEHGRTGKPEVITSAPADSPRTSSGRPTPASTG
ncbi:hypothetical protein [Mycolicibacterium sarraceniae]|uniref:LLM class F420-dependent oxidoreductase n=1 Tax=Mycolicibacterium sarraceniae TaxID=1534348 RepID=A0A7I7SNI1_9MYCO|nr:hypothetical protein [Mycolicibacterium sarraceniae]BBY58554.1 hypothetical protein MSAR_16900 [Mycolicibacterium sarraceniae]